MCCVLLLSVFRCCPISCIAEPLTSGVLALLSLRYHQVRLAYAPVCVAVSQCVRMLSTMYVCCFAHVVCRCICPYCLCTHVCHALLYQVVSAHMAWPTTARS